MDYQTLKSSRLRSAEVRERRKNLKFGRSERVPLLKEIGIAVFRQVEGQALSETMQAFHELSTDLTTQPRGVGTQKEPALNQLQMQEVEWNRALIGKIAVQDALDSIYREVPTVRRKLPALRPMGVELFGRKEAPVRSVCLTFDEDSEAILREESRAIHDTLEDMTSFDPSSFRWLVDSRPHLSLGKISTNVAAGEIPLFIGRLEQVCPTELVLCRATLHNPYDNT